ncbi:hypothetical protein GCM10011390_15960 [Aureimonas endophytica]|uniref:DUF2442 domain-containing protein n=1 Tax=Aureimonas endophytica TaxID=2027858 RepID=A0A916ZHJ0_9HYPH|nr:DUF2442 domain-containing protein [Aureimonas endophytica]GGD97976.1 hypothetical protein GCM10011390_15960 [Aureimonas endophytica]
MSNSDTDLDRRQPVDAWCDDHDLYVRLRDGRQIATPLWWYPALAAAGPAQRANMQLMYTGIHWPDLDEDLSIAGMLAGWRAADAVPPAEAAE